MNKKQEIKWIERAIVALEKKILKNPKGKIYMIAELKALQKDLEEIYFPWKERICIIPDKGELDASREGEK